MTDTVYKVSVDATAANAELDHLHKSATSAAGAEDKLRTSTAAVSRQLSSMAPAAKAAGDAQLTLQQRAAKLPDVLGKQAAAISLVSSSLDGMGGGVGKAVAGAGQMAAAFGAGGPFAAALIGGIALVSMFDDHLKDIEKARESAFEKDFERQHGNVLRLAKATQELNKELRQLDTDLRYAGVEGQVNLVRSEEMLRLRDQANKLQNRSLTSDVIPMDERERLRAEARQLELQADKLQAIVVKNLEIKRAVDEVKEAEDKRTKGVEAYRKAKAQEATDADEMYRLTLQRIRQNTKDVLAAQAEEQAVFSDSSSSSLGNYGDDVMQRADEVSQYVMDRDAAIMTYRAELREKDKEAEKQAAQDRAAIMSDYATTATSIAAGASQQLIADLIGGQEQALERFGLNIMAQAGQALVSYGTQAIGAAALSASLGNLPAAGVQAATGGALLVTGVGLGGVSAGLGTLLGGGASTSGGAARGAPRGPSGGATAGGGGGTNITIVYSGAAGPSADQGARAVIDAQTRAASRDLGRSPDR